MTVSAQPGPQSVTGNQPPLTGPVSSTGGSAALNSNANPDAAPSLFYMGVGVRDPRYMSKIGGSANVAGSYPNQDCGWLFAGAGIAAIDAIPSLVATNNIAAAAVVATGVPMTLVGASGAGITLLANPFTVLPTGLIVPKGALAIDGNPAWAGAGASGAFAFFNPANGLARAVSITASATATGGSFSVFGYDVYGNPMHETIVAVTNTTVNGKKAFKWVASVTPAFNDGTAGHTYSVGDADIYGFAAYAPEFANALIYWNNALITANAGFTAGLALATPSTATTADVRGTYATQSASDGTKKLTVFQSLPFGIVSGSGSYATAVQNLVGNAQF